MPTVKRTRASGDRRTGRRKKKPSGKGGKASRTGGEQKRSDSSARSKTNAGKPRPAPKPAARAQRRPTGKARRKAVLARRAGPELMFPGLTASGGQARGGVFIALADRKPSVIEFRSVVLEQSRPEGLRRRSGPFVGIERDPEPAARMLSGLAHPDRIRLMIALEPGEQTHKALADAVRLRPGPLYHHLHALERAGLIQTAGRNRYELSETGASALMLATGLWIMTGASRRIGPWRRERSSVRLQKSKRG